MALILAQFPITSQNVDKFLSLDLPSLVLVVAVVIGLTLLVSSYFQGRGRLSADEQQSSVIKFFTDDKSPMVQSSNRVAKAIEDQTTALLALGAKTDTQTGELSKQTDVIQGLSKATNDFSGLVTRDLSTQTETIATLNASVAALGATFTNGMTDLKALIQERIPNPADCNEVKARIDRLETTMLLALGQTVKRATTETNMVVVPEQSLKIEAQTKEPEPSGAGLN